MLFDWRFGDLVLKFFILVRSDIHGCSSIGVWCRSVRSGDFQSMMFRGKIGIVFVAEAVS